MDEQPPAANDETTPSTPEGAAPPPPPAPPAQPPAQWVPPMATQSAPPTGTNGMAVAALVLGIIALITFWSVWLGVILGILAIIFGVVGMNKAKQQNAPNRGVAVAGLVLGIIAVVGSLLWLATIVAVVEDDNGILDEIGSQIEFCLDNPDDPSC